MNLKKKNIWSSLACSNLKYNINEYEIYKFDLLDGVENECE